jgi:hypothetical protein
MKLPFLCRFLVLFAASALVIVVGCGYDNGLKLASVRGKVTYKGEPVKNGTVFFMPDEGKGTIGPSATGSLREDGTYIASTDYAGDGVIVGSHKIGLTSIERATADGTPVPTPETGLGGPIAAKGSGPGATKGGAAGGRHVEKQKADLFTDSGGRKYRYLLPKRLSNPNESGVTAKVERGSNTLNFDISEDGQVRVSR